jgi:hypothetical protein
MEDIMDTPPIDNFEDWQTALDKLQELKDACALGECQASLARIVGYRENWRLRERALEYAVDIDEPEPELLEAICHVMIDEDTYVGARVLAAEALRVLVPRSVRNAAPPFDLWKASLITKMHGILGCPQAPLFREAVTMALDAIGSGPGR